MLRICQMKIIHKILKYFTYFFKIPKIKRLSKLNFDFILEKNTSTSTLRKSKRVRFDLEQEEKEQEQISEKESYSDIGIKSCQSLIGIPSLESLMGFSPQTPINSITNNKKVRQIKTYLCEN